ncbi:ABC transporter substrate-binding protein, partial [Streptomyces sp. NPDC048491]
MARTVPSCDTPRPSRPGRRVAVGAAVLALTATAALPARGAAGDDAKGGEKVLTVAVSQSVDSLSPFLA